MGSLYQTPDETGQDAPLANADETSDESGGRRRTHAAGERTPRIAALLRLLGWSVCFGLTAGMISGTVLALREGWEHRELLAVRQWTDVLSYSAAAHGLGWAIHGAIGACVWGLLTIGIRRLLLGIRPGGMAIAIWLAGVVTVTTWMIGSGGPPQAPFLRLLWWVFRLGAWLLLALAIYLPLHVVAGTILGRLGRRVAKVVVPLTFLLLIACLAIQWRERPQLIASSPVRLDGRAAARSDNDKPLNVIFIVLDTQRLDRLGCYGYERTTTPCLDAVAADAMVFDRCYSAGIWTLPSHASMFTGLFPSEHGANYGHMWLDDRFTTMAELLARLGYDTIAFSNNAWVGKGSNLSQGFDRVIWPTAVNRVRGNLLQRLLDEVGYPAGLVGTWIGAATAQDEGAKHTNQLVDRWLAQRESDRPFFLFVNYLEPHSPYRPPLPHRRPFVPEDELEASYRNGWVWEDVFRFSLLRQGALSDTQLRLFNETYNGETRLLDGYVGDLLARLATHVSLDDCLLVITSDHGENIGDHHLMVHYWCVYDTLAHVPLIVRHPRRLPRGRCDALVQTTDLLPTVLDAVHGRPVPTESTFGRSLFDVVASVGTEAAAGPSTPRAATSSSRPVASTSSAAEKAEPVAVVELMKPEGFGINVVKQMIEPAFDAAPFTGVFRAIRQGPWKLIVGPQGRTELYHLEHDPAETEDLSARHGAVARRLRERLSRWLEAGRPYRGPEALRGQDALDDETRRRLQGLGYIQ